MMQLRWWRMAAACLTLLTIGSVAWSAPVPADKSGLDQVPASAPIVIHVRGAQGVRDRLVALMENALPEVLKQFQPQMDDALKNGIQGRKLRGLLKNGPIFIVFTELPKPNENPPKMAVIAAVSNYKEFRDNLLTEKERKAIQSKNGVDTVVIEGQNTYFVDRKSYAVVTPHEEVAATFTKKYPGIDGKLSKDVAAKLLASDVGVFIGMDTLNKEYAEQIKQGKDALEQLFNLVAVQADQGQKNIIEMARKAIDPVFQAIEDSQGVLLTVEFRPGGLALHAQSEVRAGSPTGKLLQDAKPTTFKDFARLPDGRAYYTALQTSSAMYKGLGSLIYGLVEDKNSKEAKKISAALEELSKAKPGVRMDAYSFPTSGLQVYHYEEPAKAVAAQLKLFRSMRPGGSGQSGNLKEKPIIKTAAEKYGDFELSSVQFVWDFEKMAEALAKQGGDAAKKQFIEGMKGLMGEKLNFWLGTDGKVVVQVSAADWTAARKLLDQYFKGVKTVGDVKAFRDVRKEMPAQASFMGLIDVVQTLGTMVDLVKPMIGNFVPPGWPVMPAKGTISFVGVSATLKPQRGSFDFFLSTDAAKEIYKAFIKPLVGG